MGIKVKHAEDTTKSKRMFIPDLRKVETFEFVSDSNHAHISGRCSEKEYIIHTGDTRAITQNFDAASLRQAAVLFNELADTLEEPKKVFKAA